MGAIQRDGFTFEVEYSVSHQNGAVHVYQDGKFIKELPFEFSGQQPNEDEIEQVVDRFLVQ
ncbi:YbxH family protein [Pseudalkalibacillus decolorationis]|uniref:YbxH family protein n=1 Tax=Pseudalkalibacillus decolorationis TaxID=163879 RepID=UPI0021479D49|nr:YbxH family protein [Pseudalkalibacillus decolorationis]